MVKKIGHLTEYYCYLCNGKLVVETEKMNDDYIFVITAPSDEVAEQVASTKIRIGEWRGTENTNEYK